MSVGKVSEVLLKGGRRLTIPSSLYCSFGLKVCGVFMCSGWCKHVTQLIFFCQIDLQNHQYPCKPGNACLKSSVKLKGLLRICCCLSCSFHYQINPNRDKKGFGVSVTENQSVITVCMDQCLQCSAPGLWTCQTLKQIRILINPAIQIVKV